MVWATILGGDKFCHSEHSEQSPLGRFSFCEVMKVFATINTGFPSKYP
jgi:hypothetical protein